MRSYHFEQPVGESPASQPVAPVRLGRHLRPVPKVMALLVAGSGILNLLSLLGGPVPAEHPAWLRDLFPMEFAGPSRTLTLLAGFTLILSAIHLWSRKRRALQLSAGLAAGSIVFHLTDMERPVNGEDGTVRSNLLRSPSRGAAGASQTAGATIDHTDIRGSKPHGRDSSGAASD